MNLFKYVEGLVEEYRGAHLHGTADQIKAELARVIEPAAAEATARIAAVTADVADPKTPQERKDEAAQVIANIQSVIEDGRAVLAGQRDVAVTAKK